MLHVSDGFFVSEMLKIPSPRLIDLCGDFPFDKVQRVSSAYMVWASTLCCGPETGLTSPSRLRSEPPIACEHLQSTDICLDRLLSLDCSLLELLYMGRVREIVLVRKLVGLRRSACCGCLYFGNRPVGRRLSAQGSHYVHRFFSRN